MSYLVPSEFVTKMVDAGESKIFMSTRDTLVRAYMAGAILALAAWFAVTINVHTGQPLAGAVLFPVGFCMLYLLGFDLLDRRVRAHALGLARQAAGRDGRGILRNWGLVFLGNFAGALTVAFMMAFVTTFGFTQPPDKVGTVIGNIGEARTLGYAAHGPAGMVTLFMRGMLCNWMVSTGVVGAMVSTDGARQGHRDVDADHAVLLHGLRAFRREHVPVPGGPDAACQLLDHGLLHLERDSDRARQPGRRPPFTGLTLYATHVKTAPKRAALKRVA